MTKSKEEELYDHALKELKKRSTSQTVIETTVTKDPDGKITKIIEKEVYVPAHYQALKLILENMNPQEWSYPSKAKPLEASEIKNTGLEMIEGYLVNED